MYSIYVCVCVCVCACVCVCTVATSAVAVHTYVRISLLCAHSCPPVEQLSSSWDLLVCVWSLTSGALLKVEDVSDVVCEEGGVDPLDAVITDMDMDQERWEGRGGEGKGGE